MALNCDLDNASAKSAVAWTGGDCTFAFWMLKTSVTNRDLCAFLLDSSGGLVDAYPKWRIAAVSGPSLSATIFNASNVSSASANSTVYSANTWTHVLCEFDATASYTGGIQLYINGTGTGSLSTSRDVSGIDVFQFGNESTTENDAWFAHFAVWNRLLSAGEKTQLQSTLPSGVSGGAPVQYCSFLTDATNSGSGGSTYDFSLTNATISSTYDSSIPTLSSGGGGEGSSSIHLFRSAQMGAFNSAVRGY